MNHANVILEFYLISGIRLDLDRSIMPIANLDHVIFYQASGYIWIIQRRFAALNQILYLT